MAFCWTTLHVKNLEESVKFYEDVVGLKVIREVCPAPGMEIAFMGFGEDGETQLELLSDASENSFPVSDQASVGFTVGSLNGKLAFLRTIGIELYGEIRQPSPFIKFCYIKDPDGISVQLVERIDPNEVKDI